MTYSTLLLISILLTGASLVSSAQDSATLIPSKLYKVTLQTKDGKFINGNLHGIGNSTFTMSENIHLLSYDIEKIENLKIHRKGSVGIGVLIGFLSGAFTGAVIGLASGDDDPKQWFAMSASAKAFAGGVALGGVGALTGAIIGLIHKKFSINGQRDKYLKMKSQMAKKFQPRID